MSDLIVNKYLDYIKKEKEFSKNTLDAYLRDLNNFLDYLEDKKISSVKDTTKPIVIKYLIHLKETGRANSTISRNLASLRSLFQYLVNKNIIKEDPTFNLKSYPTEKKAPSVLTIEEVNRLIQKPNDETIKGSRDKAMIHLISTTGLRVSQLINLNVEDINLKAGIVYIKEDATRAIPIDELTIKSVKNYLYNFRREFKKDDPLFINMYGNRLSRQGFWKILRHYANKAGIEKKVTPHTLRHSFAANLIQKGVDVDKVQEILGHTDKSTTELYVERIHL